MAESLLSPLLSPRFKEGRDFKKRSEERFTEPSEEDIEEVIEDPIDVTINI